jgi:hypothetical protein
MLQFIGQNKTLIAGGLALLLGTLYFWWGSGDEPLLTTSQEPSPVSQELLLTLTNLQTIKLDASIFSDPAFQSLSDYGVVIPRQNVGRRNPFAPLGSGSGASTSTPSIPAPR